MRLGIVSALAANESLTFNELKKLLETTDGNLSVHARKLEEAGYISCTKSFEGPAAQDRVPAHRAGPPRAGAVSGPHGGADPGHAGRAKARLFFMPLTLRIKVLHCTPPSSWTATAAGPPPGLPRVAGHRAGAIAVRRTVEAARISASASSRCTPSPRTTGAARADEVAALMDLLGAYLDGDARCVENGVRLEVIGRRDRLPRISSAPSSGPKPPRPGVAGCGCGLRWTTPRATRS